MPAKLSRRELSRRATLTDEDLAEVHRCRRAHNQLGFAYQVGFVRLHNRFPMQRPFELEDELVVFMALQLGVDPALIDEYRRRQPTRSEHQQRIVEYLHLRRFDDDARHELEAFVFEAATRLEQNATLRNRAEEFLAERRILRPADSTIARVVGEQRQRARDHIFGRVAEARSCSMRRFQRRRSASGSSTRSRARTSSSGWPSQLSGSPAARATTCT